MNILKVWIPLEPIGKQRHRAEKRGNYINTYTPHETRNWESRAAEIFSITAKKEGWEYIETGSVFVRVHGIFEHLKKHKNSKLKPFLKSTKPDGDNLEKIAWDSAVNSKSIIKTDSQIAMWMGSKTYVLPGQEQGVLFVIQKVTLEMMEELKSYLRLEVPRIESKNNINLLKSE